MYILPTLEIKKTKKIYWPFLMRNYLFLFLELYFLEMAPGQPLVWFQPPTGTCKHTHMLVLPFLSLWYYWVHADEGMLQEKMSCFQLKSCSNCDSSFALIICKTRTLHIRACQVGCRFPLSRSLLMTHSILTHLFPQSKNKEENNKWNISKIKTLTAADIL